MNPIEFKGQNTVYAKNQAEYKPLPALKLEKSPTGEVISCWHMSFYERLKILITGKVWVSLMCFNKPLTPSYLTVNRKELFTLTEDNYIFSKNKKS